MTMSSLPSTILRRWVICRKQLCIIKNLETRIVLFFMPLPSALPIFFSSGNDNFNRLLWASQMAELVFKIA